MKEILFLEASFINELSFIKVWELIWPKALSFLTKLFLAFLIFLICKKVIKLLLGIVQRGFDKSKIDQGVKGFALSVCKILLYLLLFTLLAEVLGIPTTSFIAVIGSAGLALGLALQGSLSNFAGGVLLLFLKPFSIGDYIVVNSMEGTVIAIDIFYTKIQTVDNKLVVLPNGALSNSNIMNVTNEPERRLDLSIPISYSQDIKTAKAVIVNVLKEYKEIIEEKPIDVFVDSFGDDAVLIGVRVWSLKEDFWPLKWALLEEIKYAFDQNNIAIPFRQMDVTIKQDVLKHKSV